MQRHRWFALLAALVLAACGGTAEQSEQSAVQPTSAPAATIAQPTSAPTTTPTAGAIATATSAAVATTIAEPTAQLILEPSAQADETAQPVFRAEPTTAPQPAAPAASAAHETPTRLVIKAIGLDYEPVSVGLDKNRVPIVPEHDVGWYNLSAAPGQGDNIVFWGHVLRFRSAPKTPAPFARLKELKAGTSVELYDSQGNKHDYAITKQIWVTPSQVEYILPQGKEMITMVSCIGDKVIQNGEVVDESHRLITIAEPVG